MPKVSIIIPVYNSGKYLTACLKSVSNQIYKDFEAILIDDGSKDDSGQMCDEYAKKDNRFRVIHKENGGVSHARNVGLDSANGDYVTFIDSDDFVLVEYLSDMMNMMVEKSQIVLSDLNGIEKENVVDAELTAEMFFKHSHLLNGSPVNKIFQKKIIEENNLRFPEGISTMEDNIFVWNYFLCCKYVSITNRNNYVYNKHENSLVRSVHKMEEIYKLSETIMPIYERLQQKLLPETLMEKDKYLFVACLKRLLISNCNEYSLKETRHLIRNALSIMKPIIERLQKRKDMSLRDKMILKMLNNRCAIFWVLFARVNSRRYNW